MKTKKLEESEQENSWSRNTARQNQKGEGIYFLGCGKTRNIFQSSRELKRNILFLSVIFPSEIQTR